MKRADFCGARCSFWRLCQASKEYNALKKNEDFVKLLLLHSLRRLQNKHTLGRRHTTTAAAAEAAAAAALENALKHTRRAAAAAAGWLAGWLNSIRESHEMKWKLWRLMRLASQPFICNPQQ